jgi:hypothetical protein
MSLKSVPNSLRVIRWPTVSWRTLSFLGGFSFLSLYLLPGRLGPMFFLIPVFGPLLLAFAGLLVMRHSRVISKDLALHPGRLFVAFVVSCAIFFVPVTVFDIFALAGFGYITLLVVVIALPFHLASISLLAAGLYALSRAEGRFTLVFRCALPVIAGFLVAIALIFVRFKYVPQSHGVFLKRFAASGSALRLPGKPLDPHGQKDINETLGDKPRSDHEPVAVIGDDSVWLVRRNQRGVSLDYWIERRAIAPAGSNWRQGLPAAPGVTRNPTALAPGPGSSIFVVGSDDVAGNASSWWLQRYDAKGAEDTNWNKSFPVRTKLCRIYGLRLDQAGSVYVFGESGEIDRRGTFGWVRKFHPDGREQIAGWDKHFPNAGEGRATMAVVGMAMDSAGSVCVLLNLYGAYSVREFDRDGRELWQRDFPMLKDLSIAADNKGNLFIYGVLRYSDEAWIKKLRADGGDAWEKSFALGDLSSACAVAFDRAQNIYVAGYGTSPRSKASQWASYWWIKKFDPNGAELTGWDKSLGDEGVNMPFALHVNFRDELYALGTGNGWQFSGSWLERWWY